MVMAKQFTCPVCGWSITSPHGDKDVAKHGMMHKEDQHPDMKLTEKEFMSMVATVEITKGWSVNYPVGSITPIEYTEADRAQQQIGKRFRTDKP